jgi:hypothetical protein
VGCVAVVRAFDGEGINRGKMIIRALSFSGQSFVDTLQNASRKKG